VYGGSVDAVTAIAGRTRRSAHVFGPIQSRRLGLSLAVDVVPLKVCSLNCVYCEAGPTTLLTLRRKEYVGEDEILREVQGVVGSLGPIDHITLSASGEPTLNSRLAGIIEGIKAFTEIPVAILTNGVLLSSKEVRDDLLGADVVLPSLDAASPEVFARVNRPHGRLNIASVIDGMVQFREEYRGPLWLEVLFVRGMNDSPEEVERLRKAIARIRPDRIHLNTVVRSPSEPIALPLDRAELLRLRSFFGERCEVI
jgi:wyosine [tRNA(Phe)-imidazoG37] synthetase (radical SAM superfamily)